MRLECTLTMDLDGFQRMIYGRAAAQPLGRYVSRKGPPRASNRHFSLAPHWSGARRSPSFCVHCWCMGSSEWAKCCPYRWHAACAGDFGHGIKTHDRARWRHFCPTCGWYKMGRALEQSCAVILRHFGPIALTGLAAAQCWLLAPLLVVTPLHLSVKST